ncbi:MAG: hypothetical protein ACLR78_10445 [Roseburia sp.]
MHSFYKLAAAVTEAVCRISGSPSRLKGLANGGMLYVKLYKGYGVLLFFVTIALTAAASGIYLLRIIGRNR